MVRPYKLHKVDNVTVVEITGIGLMEGPELDQMATHLSEELMRSQDKRMVVDCQRLKFMASAALSVIVRLAQTAKQLKGGLAICGVQAQVKQVLKISGLDRQIPVCDSRDEAVALLAEPNGGTA